MPHTPWKHRFAERAKRLRRNAPLRTEITALMIADSLARSST
jgi:hypothetical protein